MRRPERDLSSRLLAEARRLGHPDLLLSRSLVVGVSGGADSLVLLHLLVELRGTRSSETLHVAHLDHGIRGQAAKDDADFVRKTAEAWGLAVTLAEYDVPAFARQRGLSVEDAARRARYAFLASLAQKRGAVVAVAHNADDQTETVLMAILRGTGVTGLAGMQPLDAAHLTGDPGLLAAFPCQETGPVELYRPLLSVWRHEIADYCRQNGLEPRIDETNTDLSYRRNLIRYDLIPYLQEHYSLAVKDHLVRLAAIARSEDELAESLAADAWGRVARESSAGMRVEFDTEEMARQPVALRRRLSRRALQIVAGTLVDFTFDHTERAAEVLSGADGAPLAFDLPHGLRVERAGGRSLVRRRGDKRLEPECERPTAGKSALPVEPGGTLELENGWNLETALVDAGVAPPEAGGWQAAFDHDALAAIGPLVLRRRAMGDYIRPLGMTGRRRLQDLMVDAKIPRECRAYLAVLASEGSSEVLWVPGPGGRRSMHAALTHETRRVLLMRFTRED